MFSMAGAVGGTIFGMFFLNCPIVHVVGARAPYRKTYFPLGVL